MGLLNMLPQSRGSSEFDIISDCNQRLKHSLNCNRKFCAYYGPILISFIIGNICALIAIFIWLFTKLYYYYCIIFEIKSINTSLERINDTDKPYHVIIISPFEGGADLYMNRLSDLYNFQIIDPFKRDNKTSV